MHPPPISTLNQSTPFYLKRSCWRSDFSPLISSKPPSERKSIEKRKKERKKVPRVSSNKRGSQNFERRKTLQIKAKVWAPGFCVTPHVSNSHD
jgi:hypothetical protein